jgi:hypothetical protein
MKNTRLFVPFAITLLAATSGRAQRPMPNPAPQVHPVVTVAPIVSPVIAPVIVNVANDDWDSGMTVREEETVRQSYPLAGADRALTVDNIFGSIDVVGIDSDQVTLVLKKTYRADSKTELEKAKKEVTLDVTNDGGQLKLYVNGPFRCNHNCDSCCCGGHDEQGYVVKMDFQLQVPRMLKLTLKTVNDGNIKVQDVSGDFSLHNVNGGIEMLDAAGSGVAKTVNGGVKMTFRAAPKANSQFATINGPIELSFPHDLSADFRFKNFNGGIYSDYELSALPNRQPESERKNGKFIFRSDRFVGGRVGQGGPEIKIENLNGDIRVIERRV